METKEMLSMGASIEDILNYYFTEQEVEEINRVFFSES